MNPQAETPPHDLDEAPASPGDLPAPAAAGNSAARGGGRTARAGELDPRVRQLRLAHVSESRFTLGRALSTAASVLLLLGLGAGLIAAPYFVYRLATGEGKSLTVNPSAPAAEAKPVEEGAAASADAPPAGSAQAPARGGLVTAPRLPPRLSRSEIALESKGYIVPAHQILVSPQVSGMIVSLNIEEGRRVNKGEVLAVLESIDYDADVARAEATVRLAQERLREIENGNRPEEIAQAEAELEETRAQIVQLRAEWKRKADLRKNGSIPQQELEIAESAYQVMKQREQRVSARLKLLQIGERAERREMAKHELTQFAADLTKARWRQSNCTIVAPISGTILKKNAEEGNIVIPGAFNGSFSLCEMADLADLEVELDIQERDVAQVKVGQLCRVRNDAWPDRIYEGVVDRLMPIADRAKAAVPVRVKLRIPPEEEGVYLKPQMGAVVTFLNKQADWAPKKPGLPAGADTAAEPPLKMPLTDGGSTGQASPPTISPGPTTPPPAAP